MTMSLPMKDAFTKVEVLEHATPASLAALASCCRTKQYKKGDALFRDKENVSCIYMVVSGYVSLYKVDAQGERKILFVLGPGKLVNEETLHNLPSSVSCDIFEDAQLLYLYRQDLLRIMENDFGLSKAILDSMSLKIRRLYRQLKNTTGALHGEKKLAAKLWKLSKDYGEPVESGVAIRMDLSITYLADMLGAKRETVSRQVKNLCKNGLLLVEKKVFIIPSQKKLAHFFKDS